MTPLISKSLFLVFLLFSIICLSFSIPSEYPIFNDGDDELDKFTSEEDIRELFRMWQKKYDREYESRAATEKRFEIFKSNLKYIREKNAQTTSAYGYRLGLNQFSDLTFEEFSKTYLGQRQPIIEGNIHEKTESDDKDVCPDAPSSIDWRVFGAVTSVKDQGSCGSCWAFSATGAIEGIYKIATGIQVNVSEQQLLSCAYNLGCKKGGWYTKGFEYVIKNGGIALENDYPYLGREDACDNEKENLIAATIDDYANTSYLSESSLFCAVAKQPVSFSIYVSNDFVYYRQGIFDGSSCIDIQPECNTSHAVLLVGYGSIFDQDYWIVKNSWGYSWGQDGYMFIQRNTGNPEGVCNSNCYGAYPTKNIVPLLDSAI